MRHRDTAGVQMKPPRPRHSGAMGQRLSVFCIAQDRGPDRGAMGAQLMRPPGDRHQGEPAHPVARAVDHPIIGYGMPALVAVGPHPFAMPPGCFGERQIDPALGRLGQSDRDSPVGLSHPLFAKSAREEPRGRCSPGQHQNAARLLVEAVNQPGPLFISEPQPVQQPVEMPLGRGAALNREARRLVEDDHHLVHVEDGGLQHGLIRRPLRVRRGSRAVAQPRSARESGSPGPARCGHRPWRACRRRGCAPSSAAFRAGHARAPGNVV